MKKSLLLATVLAASLSSGIAAADLTANAGIFSNYIWRGVTQTADAAAGQGGIDWGDSSGLYAGTWVSTLGNGNGNGYEMDLYGGFAGQVQDFSYDLGAITYQYPTSTNANFTEITASGTFKIITAGIAYTVDKAGNSANENDLYSHASLDFPVSKSDVSLYVGHYSFDDPTATDYSHYGASLSKDGFGFAVDKNDMDSPAGSVRFTVSYSKDFTL